LLVKQNPEMQAPGPVRVECMAIGMCYCLGAAFAEVKNLRRKLMGLTKIKMVVTYEPAS